MSEHPQDTGHSAQALPSAKEKDAKLNALIAYGLLAAGLFTGIAWLIGGIWAMVKLSEARGTLYEDHYLNIIKTFWWTIGLSIVSFVLMFVFVGYFIFIGVYIWSIFKVVKGLAKITSDRAYND